MSSLRCDCVFAGRGTSTTLYASQHTHSREPMCTSVSLHWVMNCLITDMPPECSASQMRKIMQHGLRTHQTVHTAFAEPSSRGMLLAQEVVTHSPLPARYSLHELHGCVGHAVPVEVKDYCVELHELHELLEAPLGGTSPVGILFTANGHTTALVACRNGLFFFDSLVAKVQQIDFTDVMGVLVRTHKLSTDDEYSVVVVTSKSRVCG